jgi:hypothetical protein
VLEADEEAKRNLEVSILNNERYPPEDLSGWINMEMAGSRQKRKDEESNMTKEVWEEAE